MSAEPTREELIEELRLCRILCETQAADLLEADAAEIARLNAAISDWRKGQKALSSRIVELEALVREAMHVDFHLRRDFWLKEARSLLDHSEGKK